MCVRVPFPMNLEVGKIFCIEFPVFSKKLQKKDTELIIVLSVINLQSNISSNCMVCYHKNHASSFQQPPSMDVYHCLILLAEENAIANGKLAAFNS